jgi:hypothetical protein
MGCPVCGVEVTADQKFCHECGTALHAAEAQELPAPSDLPTEELEPAETAAQWGAPSRSGPTEEFSLPDPTPASGLVIVPTDEPIVVPQNDVQPAATTDEMPAIFDGHADLAEYPLPREPFRLRMVFLLAIFGAVAVVMTALADVTDIRTTRPAAGITTGTTTLADLGTNLAVGGWIGAAVMVVGGFLACFGLRWGAGLAGGAGLALLGWAGLTIGLAEYPIAVAESITRTSPESFVLRVTRDLGWWLVAGVGVVGLLVFVASLSLFGTGRRRGLGPWIAATTAVAIVVLAAGPLVPVGSATFAGNFRSPTAAIDLPTAYFAGRLGQVLLIFVTGVIGMLVVRAYGLGLAAGGLSVAAWLWATSLGEYGSRPIGLADRNPGAADTLPHGVTSVGMVLSIALLLLAATMAVARTRRVDRS